jgi:hypothetical protein
MRIFYIFDFMELARTSNNAILQIISKLLFRGLKIIAHINVVAKNFSAKTAKL